MEKKEDQGIERKLAKKRKKRFSKENLECVKASFEKRGIVYIGRIPPRMVRHHSVHSVKTDDIQDVRICRRILSQYGEIGRMHFANEDIDEYKERKESGGYKKRGYSEGWVEFMDKTTAKKFVRRYNGQPIGGKKRSPFYEELWCIKYLSKFKWDHLLEGIRYRKMLYQQEVQQELADAKKQQETYLNRVQAARRLEQKTKTDKEHEESEYTQITPLPDPVESDKATELSDDLLVLFGRHAHHQS